jgi:hypothetical protein
MYIKNIKAMSKINKTILKKYVDFQKICQMIVDDEELTNLFLQRNKEYKQYVDNDMDKLRREPYFSNYVDNSYLKMLENASTYDYNKTNEQIDVDSDIPIKIISYGSTQDEHHIYYIKIGDYEEDHCFEMFGLIDDIKNKYIFIGIDQYHPFICANDFEYYQSDGSTDFSYTMF